MISLLNPNFNHGVDVTVCTRVQERDEYGEIENTITSFPANVIWAELGYRSKRTNQGKRVYEAVEVHMLPEFNYLVPGRDFFIKDGIEYRIESRLDMNRVVGVVQYEIIREIRE